MLILAFFISIMVVNAITVIIVIWVERDRWLKRELTLRKHARPNEDGG